MTFGPPRSVSKHSFADLPGPFPEDAFPEKAPPPERMPSSHQRRRRYYRRYAERLGRRLDVLDRQSARFGWARLAVVVAGAAAAWGAFAAASSGVGWAVLGTALAAFVVLARVHRRVERSQQRHRLWRAIKREHAARLRRDWDALPPSPPRRSEEASPPELSPGKAHPFAAGLDITGPRSLLRLIDTCATEGGSRRLQNWLTCTTPQANRARRRQERTRELVPLSAFRDRLALEGRSAARGEDEKRRRWSDRALRRWLGEGGGVSGGERQTADGSHAGESAADAGPAEARALLPWIAGLGALAATNGVLVLGHALGALPPVWAATVPLYLLLYTFQLPAVKGLFDEVEELQQAFRRLRSALRFLEERPLAGRPGLQDVLAPVRRREGRRPSRHLRRVGRIAAAASSRRSELLMLVNLLGPWDLTVAYLLRKERAALAEDLPAWLDAWYELEALSALAAMKGRRPEASFPEIAAPGARPVLEGEGLGHPLLPEEEKVRNGIAFEAPGAVALITGSNMAGKSTFLRTLGLNLCLAYAGGPVDARRLRAVPMRLFTCIDVTDAVTGGLSYFYAEVRRLRALMEALQEETGAPPLFYLIDEIFRGTNNRERLIGSRAYLRALAQASGLGAVATHDLELTELAEEIAGLDNYHFREQVEPGGEDGEARMTFDYRLRRGPCPTTNALKIMRAAGLPTDGFAEAEREDERPAPVPRTGE